MRDLIFLSRQGYYLRSAENVLRYIQAQRAYEAERGDVPFDFGSPSAGGGNVHGVQPPNKEEDGGGGQQGMQSKNQQQIEIDEKRKVQSPSRVSSSWQDFFQIQKNILLSTELTF